jgi:hypothetical protein
LQKSHFFQTLKKIKIHIKQLPLQVMLKKYFAILMMFIAVAVMLGHNIIGHHHHNIEQTQISHHSHSNNDHHQHDNDTENEDWKHIFAGFQHGADGIVCLTSKTASNNIVKLIPKFNALNVTNFTFKQATIDVRQNAPPFTSDYYNSQNHLPSGLRAPPIFIV